MRTVLVVVALFASALANGDSNRHRRDVSLLSHQHQYHHPEQRFVILKSQPVAEPLPEKQSFQLPKVNHGPPFRAAPKPIVDVENDPRLNKIVNSYENPIVDAELVSLMSATRVPVPHTTYGVPDEYVRAAGRQNYQVAPEVYEVPVPLYRKQSFQLPKVNHGPPFRAAPKPIVDVENGVPDEYVRAAGRQNYQVAPEVYEVPVPLYHGLDAVGYPIPLEEYILRVVAAGRLRQR